MPFVVETAVCEEYDFFCDLSDIEGVGHLKGGYIVGYTQS